MTSFLLFRLYGAMAAYGDIAVGERRPAFPQPTRSSVLGLLCAALGIRRDQSAELDAVHNGYRVATRLDTVDGFVSDFHTIQTAPENKLKNRVVKTRADELSIAHSDLKTILSRRDYHCDTQSVVAVWADDKPPHSLDQLAHALRKPVYTLYLGRRACPPALPLHPVLVQADHPVTALDKWNAHDDHVGDILRHRLRPAEYRWEGTFPNDPPKLQTTWRRDQPLHRIRWQFVERQEHMMVKPVKEAEHVPEQD